MSVNGIDSKDFQFSLLPKSSAAQQAASTRDAEKRQGTESFQSSLMLRIAEIKSQSFGTLMSTVSGSDSDQGASSLDAILGIDKSSDNSLDAIFGNNGTTTGLSSTGRNTSLFDPESAYQMMSTINTKDVTYKAEFVEMNDLKAYLNTMQQEALKLKDLDSASANSDIRSHVQAFADAYNGWIQRFDDELKPGGLLAGTQAAQVSQWELEQSVENFFNGAKEGLHGMRDLGLTIDPVTNLASVDASRLDAVLANNKTGAIGTIHEFTANFAKSAELLNSEGNFVPNRLNNLSRVIDYIEDNKSSLQTEFGMGDAAKPTGLVARALASYNAIYGQAQG